MTTILDAYEKPSRPECPPTQTRQAVPWSRYSGPATSLHAHVRERGSLPTHTHEGLTVLQNVPDDTEFVEITTTTLGAKGLLETNLDVAN